MPVACERTLRKRSWAAVVGQTLHWAIVVGWTRAADDQGLIACIGRSSSSLSLETLELIFHEVFMFCDERADEADRDDVAVDGIAANQVNFMWSVDHVVIIFLARIGVGASWT